MGWAVGPEQKHRRNLVDDKEGWVMPDPEGHFQALTWESSGECYMPTLVGVWQRDCNHIWPPTAGVWSGGSARGGLGVTALLPAEEPVEGGMRVMISSTCGGRSVGSMYDILTNTLHGEEGIHKCLGPCEVIPCKVTHTHTHPHTSMVWGV